MGKDQPESHGGQAVIEGVMMKGRKVMATAVRRTDGSIIVDKRAVLPWSAKYPILKYPIFRGAVALVESLVVGMSALTFSAAQFAEGEDVELSGKDTFLMILFALALTVIFFVALPALLIRLIQGHIPHGVGSTIFLNVVEGLIKIGFFAGYVAAIGRFNDIRRVFEYHGAEHKTINAFESGAELTVENVRPHTCLHYRCGSSFILLVLIVSVFIFSFFGRPPLVQRILIHLAILPLVAGLSFELIRYSSRKDAFFLLRWLASPGLLVQKLTTREPDDTQIEVAIRALQEVLAGLPEEDGATEPTAPPTAPAPAH